MAVPTDWAIADPMAVTTIADTSIAREVENDAKIGPAGKQDQTGEDESLSAGNVRDPSQWQHYGTDRERLGDNHPRDGPGG